MEDWLAQERAAEQNVQQILKDSSATPAAVCGAFTAYRSVFQVVVAFDFQNAGMHEARLWQAHTDGRRFFHRALSNIRKSNPDHHVGTRALIKVFVTWIKQSQQFYRQYVFQLSSAAGGIPELEAIAQRDHVEVTNVGESQPATMSPDQRSVVLDSCHRTLVYLGDLCRYRASEKLDKNPDFGPAIGYYGLAATLKPSSGLGHHQQAVVALEQRHHLRAIYHLYRSISVQDPHPHAANNLRLEFDKTNAAWDRGDLIQKGPPNDPNASKNVLVGWFVRLHSMCYRGEPFASHAELEREVLSQLCNVLQQRDLDETVLRMILINIAAQNVAGDRFQQEPHNPQDQQSWLFYVRLNLKTFTKLLQLFHGDLRRHLLNIDPHGIEMPAKLTILGRRLLPTLRIYNNWLLTMTGMILGLAAEDFLSDSGESVSHFWPAYAKTIDLVAQAFPVWDMDEVSEVPYMLEEDALTLEFKPLVDDKTLKTWIFKSNGTRRPRFSDKDVVRVSPDEEMLHRIRGFLDDGVAIAMDPTVETFQINQENRIFCGNDSNIEPLTVPELEFKAPEKPKPVSYARAAASAHSRVGRPAPMGKPTASKAQARDAQLSRMVDDLVDDDEGNNPVTPPQQNAANPAIVMNGEMPDIMKDSMHDLPNTQSKPAQHTMRPLAQAFSPRPDATITPPGYRQSRPAPIGSERGQRDRLQSVSKFWDNASGSTSPSFSSELPTGTLASPSQAFPRGQGHSRVNSASSIRSRTSLNGIDPWGSTESSASRTLPDNTITNTVYGTSSYSSLDQTGMASPLLFGAGGGLWSTGTPTRPSFRQASPSNAQGG